MRADPGDEHDEEAGQQHLRGVERRLRRRHPDAGEAHLLRAGAVAVEERLLAADAAQDAEPAAVSAPSAVSWPTSSRCSR